MKYNVTLSQATENTDQNTASAQLTVELEATTVREVRTLARAQNPGHVVKKVRRQKQKAA